MADFIDHMVLGPLRELGRQALAILPNVMAMVLLVSVGLFLAWGLGRGVERLLRFLKLDHLCNRLGVNDALLRGGVKSDPSHLVGRAAFWAVAVFAVVAGLGALNLRPVNEFARSFLGYIPHLFTASLIIAAGYLLSNFVSRAVLIAAVNAGLPPARMIAALARWGVQLAAVAMALEQLGIAKTVVVVGFGITLGGLVLAAAIAFGLGAKDLAKEFLERRLSGKSPNSQPDDLRHM